MRSDEREREKGQLSDPLRYVKKSNSNLIKVYNKKEALWDLKFKLYPYRREGFDEAFIFKIPSLGRQGKTMPLWCIFSGGCLSVRSQSSDETGESKTIDTFNLYRT